MSSRVVDFSIPAQVDYSLQPIELVRTLAKINLTTSITGFEIVAVSVLNANTLARVIPAQGRHGLPERR